MKPRLLLGAHQLVRSPRHRWVHLSSLCILCDILAIAQVGGQPVFHSIGMSIAVYSQLFTTPITSCRATQIPTVTSDCVKSIKVYISLDSYCAACSPSPTTLCIRCFCNSAHLPGSMQQVAGQNQGDHTLVVQINQRWTFHG